MNAGAVVGVALKNLGRRHRVTVGIRNQLIVLSTWFQPRVMNRDIIGAVIKHSEAIWTSTTVRLN